MAMLDTGASSSATFILGLAAAVLLSPGDLGAYQIFWSFALLLSVVPYQRWGVPLLRAQSVGDMPKHVFVGGGVRMLATAWVMAVLMLLPGLYVHEIGDVGPTTVWKLALGASTVVVGIPLRDALRGLAHLIQRQWVAVGSSVVQLFVMGAAVWLFASGRIESAWLLLGYGLSLIGASSVTLLGVLSALRPNGQAAIMPAPVGFVAGSAFPQASAPWSYWLIESMESLRHVGYLSGASQIGQGLYMFASALNMVFLGDSTRAGATRNLSAARASRRGFQIWIGLASLSLSGVFLLPPVAGTLAKWMPNAFAIEGLGVCIVVAILVERASLPMANELVGATEYRYLTAAQVVTTLVSMVAVLSVVWIGVFAYPLAATMGGVAKFVMFWIKLRIHYGQAGGKAESESVAGDGVGWDGRS